MNNVLTVIGIIVSIVGVIVSILGIIIPVILAKSKEKRENKINKKKEQQLIFEQRPEFSIEEYKNYLDRPGYGIKQKCDIGVFLSFVVNETKEGCKNLNLREDDFVKENWCCIFYKIKNIGKTDIKYIDIVSNQKRVIGVFNSENIEHVDKTFINYCESLDRIVKVNEEITLKICFNKDRILHSLISANLCLGIIDENDHYWMQPLFVPDKKLYNSYRVNKKDYLERVNYIDIL